MGLVLGGGGQGKTLPWGWFEGKLQRKHRLGVFGVSFQETRENTDFGGSGVGRKEKQRLWGVHPVGNKPKWM